MPDNDLSDILNFRLLLTLAIIAILVSLVFHFFFVKNIAVDFTEIYFPEPDSLPGDVYLGQDYNVTFVVRNAGQNPTTLDVDAKIEFYKLYDVTEGIYKCVARQRQKAMLQWVQGNKSTFEYLFAGPYDIEPEQAQIPKAFITESSDYADIDWPYYTITYRFKEVLQSGNFSTYFHDNGTLKYAFVIYPGDPSIEAVYKSNGSIVSEWKSLNLTPLKADNSVEIRYNETMSYYLNGEIVFNFTPDNATIGRPDFKAEDNIVVLGSLLMYKETPVEITEAGDIREYSINNKIILGIIENLSQEVNTDVPLFRQEQYYYFECPNDECDSLKAYLDGNYDVYKFNNHFGNASEENILGMLTPLEEQVYQSYYLSSNGTAKELDWENFTLRLSWQTFSRQKTFLLSLKNNLSILIRGTDIYVITNNETESVAYKVSNELEESAPNELMIESWGGKLVFYMNKRPFHRINWKLSVGDFEMKVSNSFVIFSDIVVFNDQPGCKRISIDQACRIVYRQSTGRQLVQARPIRAVTTPVEISAELTMALFLAVGEFFQDEAATSREYAGGGNETGIVGTLPYQQPGLTIADLLDYEIDIDASLINENIPSEKFVFAGPTAQVSNFENYSFSYSFYLLEGLGLLDTSFFQDDRLLLSVIISKQAKEAYLFRNLYGTLTKDTASLNLTWNDRNNFDFVKEMNETTIYINRIPLFAFSEPNVSKGYFGISSYNTYVELTGINLFNKERQRRIQFNIDKDPCSLKKVGEVQMTKDSLYLGGGEAQSYHSTFRPEGDFDYGKATFTTTNEQGNQTEIHFWVIRHD